MINDICSSSRNACLPPLSTSSTLLGGKRCGTDETINTSLSLARPALRRRRGLGGATVVLDDFRPMHLLLIFTNLVPGLKVPDEETPWPIPVFSRYRATSESGSLGSRRTAGCRCTTTRPDRVTFSKHTPNGEIGRETEREIRLKCRIPGEK